MGRSIGNIESGTNERCLIGIDPGSTTGVCLLFYDSKKIQSLFTSDFWGIYELLLRSKEILASRSQVYIEQPSMVKALYARHGKRLEELQSKIQTRDRIVWNSAENAREGILLRNGLRNLGYTCFDCRPVGRKKWTSEQFQAATGYPDRSNQHVRDATFLVWDKHWQDVSQV